MAKTVIVKPMPAGTDVNFALPNWLLLEIAKGITLFSRLEHKVIEIYWTLGKVEEVKGRVKSARRPARDNFDAILTAIEEAAGSQFDAVRRAFEESAEERNLMSHGVWMMAGDRPYVVWHKFLEDTDSVIGEYFEKLRFERFERKVGHLLETCVKFHNVLDEIRAK